MTRTLIASVALAFSMAALGDAQQQASSASAVTHLTHAQLKQLVHGAHTQEQYNTLATYYREKDASFSQQAAQERHEWIRRSQNVSVVAAKYPRPADSARYLYEYYAGRAERANLLADKYEQLEASESK